jgi:uncharacterized protein YcfJ
MSLRFVRYIAALLIATTAGAATAFAEDAQRRGNRFSPEALHRVIRESTSTSPSAPRAQPSNSSTRKQDSILNGGVIGAVIGGVAGSLLWVAAAGASDDFTKATLKGAVGGFAIGAVIDALH